jgi:hypothetical protein
VRRLFLLPIVLACAACAGASVQTEGTGRTGAGPAICRPGDLHGLFRGFQGAGNSLAGAVVVVDTGPRPCLLNGSPRSVGLLDDGGGTVSVRERALDQPPGGAVELRPGAALPAFGAPPMHGSAWVSLVWSNWCSSTSPAIRSTLVVLPTGGSIAAPLDSVLPAWAVGPPVPRCADSRAPSSLTFGRFQPAA